MCGIALLYRSATGLHPYSGEATPPTYGDYEAQRHWMEITLALPPRLWYRECPGNNLAYWGLDYPPLSGYASYVAGVILGRIEPSAVEFVSSHGYESATSRAAMRASVLAADLFVLFPALVACSVAPWRRSDRHSKSQQPVLAFALSLPALVIIDHGHFQYNGVGLGLFVASATAMSRGMFAGGAALFCLSVYFKQMNLYLAPALAAYLLSVMTRQGSFVSWLRFATKIGVAILGTTSAIFYPWLFPRFDIAHLMHRLFPVARGLFEDKVANFWCSMSILVKVKRLMSQETLFMACAVCTVAASLPFCIAVGARPSPRQLLLSCAGCSLAAYLFSYQVHEKQILIPLMPVALLADSLPTLATYMSFVAAFSMYPLLNREGLSLAYFALLLMHAIVVEATLARDAMGKSTLWRYFEKVSLTMVLVLHAAKEYGPTVKSKPDLYTVLMTCFACLHLCVIYLILLYHSFDSVEMQGARRILPTKSKMN